MYRRQIKEKLVFPEITTLAKMCKSGGFFRFSLY